MKKINILFAILIILCTSCEDWLDQEDSRALPEDQVYSSIDAISGVAANLYSRLRYEQDFGFDYDPYGDRVNTGHDLNDLCRWDEASNNSAYWDWAFNVNRDYRNYYDYGLVRDINIHIDALKQTSAGPNITEEQRKYFLGEARYMRAFVYFTMVSRMGGVPIIEEVFEYTEHPLELARPRNKEAEVYDFIVNELDAVFNDLDIVSANIKTRATKGSALALKCRAMLYAGTIAYNYEKNAAKNLILPSGATGIEKSRANEYFQKCIDAYLELKKNGNYSLYKASSDYAKNYADLFLSCKNNSEIIFCRDYDGILFKNSYTHHNICAQLRPALKTGCIMNPSFNQVGAYEIYSTRKMESINPYNGPLQMESMADGISTHSYKIYDNPEDIFADRDPRLAGSILHPGSSFRGLELDFQAGLAIKTAEGYEFKTIDAIENINVVEKNTYNSERITGIEGPHRSSTYVSHSGFLVRKFMDLDSQSEAEGASSVPYIVFRYGEVLLNAAEAAFYLSENGVASYNGRNTRELALECMNEIRERAGGETFKIIPSELTFERIMNERRVELAFEDHRYNDLKRWRLADQLWAYDQTNQTAIVKGLWPYKIYAPGDENHGKWIYRQVRLEHRGSTSRPGEPLNFDVTMYYATYPMNEGNPYIEKNPNH